MNVAILTPQPPPLPHYLGTAFVGGRGLGLGRVKTWLTYCGHFASIQTQVPGHFFLFYEPPNQWRGRRSLPDKHLRQTCQL